MAEITITYETLFELLRREKNREELQKLDADFFKNLAEYLKDKQNILKQNTASLFSFEEKESVEKQLQNIRKIIRELYDRREKKIIYMALNKSRTNSELMDTSALLKEENGLFDALTALFLNYREGILDNILKANIPEIKNLCFSNEFFSGEKSEKEKPKDLKTDALPSQQESVLVRFLQDIPGFVGPELEQYGPFEEEEMANLPEKVAFVLVEKGKAEVINNSVKSSIVLSEPEEKEEEPAEEVEGDTVSVQEENEEAGEDTADIEEESDECEAGQEE